MNIAICVNSLSAGGAEIFAASLALEYVKRKHSVIIIVLNVLDDKGSTLESSLEAAGVKIINFHYHNKIEMILYPVRLARIFKKHKIDVIHSNLEQMDFFVMLSSFLYPRPIKIRTLHSMNAFPGFPYFIHKLLFMNFDKSVGCGVLMKKNYTIAKLRPDIYTIDNGIAITDITPSEASNIRNKIRAKLNISNNEFVFLQIGRMTPVLGALCKGHDFTFKAVNSLKRKDFKVIFIGDDSCKTDGNIYDQSLVNDDRLLFEGITSDPLQYIFASDAILAPSRVEGLPISTLEGVIYGKPVVCSNIEVFNILLDSSTVRMDIDNPDELADKMDDMIINYKKYHAFAKQNIEHYKNKYSIERTAGKYLSLINSIQMTNTVSQI